MNLLEKIKNLLETLDEKRLHFMYHFHEQSGDRPVISEDLVKSFLRRPERLLSVREEPAEEIFEEKYALVFKMSGRYVLNVIILTRGKSLYIITAWNELRK